MAVSAGRRGGGARLLLASDEASYITAAHLVDGGMAL
jgi:hypothetical protein